MEDHNSNVLKPGHGQVSSRREDFQTGGRALFWLEMEGSVKEMPPANSKLNPGISRFLDLFAYEFPNDVFGCYVSSRPFHLSRPAMPLNSARQGAPLRPSMIHFHVPRH